MRKDVPIKVGSKEQPKHIGHHQPRCPRRGSSRSRHIPDCEHDKQQHRHHTQQRITQPKEQKRPQHIHRQLQHPRQYGAHILGAKALAKRHAHQHIQHSPNDRKDHIWRRQGRSDDRWIPLAQCLSLQQTRQITHRQANDNGNGIGKILFHNRTLSWFTFRLAQF